MFQILNRRSAVDIFPVIYNNNNDCLCMKFICLNETTQVKKNRYLIKYKQFL